jgi:hypothetical protein
MSEIDSASSRGILDPHQVLPLPHRSVMVDRLEIGIDSTRGEEVTLQEIGELVGTQTLMSVF